MVKAASAQDAETTARRDGSDGGGTAADCFGRDVFEGSDPEAAVPPEPLREPRAPLRRFVTEHRVAVGLFLGALVITLFIVAVLPQITGIGTTLDRLGHGNVLWLAVGAGLEAASIAGYIVLFRAVFSCEGTRIGWKASYEITMAGVVATKLFAAAGAGGIALTAWALRAAGLPGRTVARRMAGFEIILYSVFMLALVIVGLGLGTGVMGTQASWSVSYLPAAFGAVVIVLALAAGLLPARFEQVVARGSAQRGRLGRLVARLAPVPAAVRDGVAIARELIREGNPGLLGALAYWAFDIATLWAAFRAFGAAPPLPAVIMGYYVGQLANAIPLPGGIGGVEGGMIGCFIALGVNAGGALIAVFAYRAISFWLPTIPGTVAYLQLRRLIGRWRASDAPAEAGAEAPVPQGA
jgi:putative heme transporter